MSAPTVDRYVSSTICHEWGHILVHYLLYGTVKNITEIQFIDTLARMDAHTVYQPYYAEMDSERHLSAWEIDSTKTKDAMIRMAGAIACKICGFHGFTTLEYDSTDAKTIRLLIPNKNKVAQLRAQTEALLAPFKQELADLTLSTLDLYPTERDENEHVRFTVPGYLVHSWVEQSVPNSMKPKQICVKPLRLDSVIKEEVDERGNVKEKWIKVQDDEEVRIQDNSKSE